MNESKPINLFGLWKNTSKDGNEYLSGNIGFGRLLVFPNTRKSKDTDPDYRLVIAERPQQDRQQGHQPQTPQDADGDVPF